jgi:hypothetical protein
MRISGIWYLLSCIWYLFSKVNSLSRHTKYQIPDTKCPLKLHPHDQPVQNNPSNIRKKQIGREPVILFQSEQTVPFERHDHSTQKHGHDEGIEAERERAVSAHDSGGRAEGIDQAEKRIENGVNDNADHVRLAARTRSAETAEHVNVLHESPGTETRRQMRQENHDSAGGQAGNGSEDDHKGIWNLEFGMSSGFLVRRTAPGTQDFALEIPNSKF